MTRQDAAQVIAAGACVQSSIARSVEAVMAIAIPAQGSEAQTVDPTQASVARATIRAVTDAAKDRIMTQSRMSFHGAPFTMGAGPWR